MLRYTWRCKCCDKQFDQLPLDWGINAPAQYEEIPEAERLSRAKLTDDFCIIDNNAFYIRGLIEIPLVERQDRFAWGVWVSLSSASLNQVQSVWNSSSRQTIGPLFGWLSTVLPLYPSSLNLKTRVHLRPAPSVPFIELEPTNHPLAIEQRNGITIERAVEITEALLPRH